MSYNRESVETFGVYEFFSGARYSTDRLLVPLMIGLQILTSRLTQLSLALLRTLEFRKGIKSAYSALFIRVRGCNIR